MKHSKFKNSLVAMMLSFTITSVYAYDFEVDGIYYNVKSMSNLTCRVTCGDTKYSGQIIIPEHVTYNKRVFIVTEIGYSAFDGCSGLTSLTIGNSVTKIDSHAFNGCSGLTSLTIGNSVTEIGSNAFDGCSGLTSLTIPDSVTEIGSNAFDGCSGLTSLTIGNSVTKIGSCTFEGCSGLTSLTIPDSVTEIGNEAFYGCSGLNTLIIETSSSTLNLGYNYTPGNSRLGKGLFYDCPLKTVFLGRNLSYDNSKSCGYSPFCNNTTLTTLTIGNLVTKIDDYAFNGCSGLKILTIEACSSTLNLGYNYTPGNSGLGKGLFYDCPLKTVYLGRNLSYDWYWEFGNSPFYEKITLTDITIGNSVTEIDSRAFNGCSGLTSLTIPDSVIEIGYSAFEGCSGLISLTIGNSVTEIDSYAFNGCSGLTSLTIPDSVTEIGNSAFEGCSGLTNLTIPKSVTKIGEETFYGCTALENVTSLATTAPTAYENSFSNITYLNAMLYIPIGSLNSYKSATCWKNFLIEEKDAGVDGVKADNTIMEKARYSIDGKILLTPKKGINIIQMNDGTTKKVVVK